MALQDETTAIQYMNDHDDIETIGDENEDMIGALQTRRKQREEELIESQPGPSGEQSEWASTQEPTQSRPPLPRSLPALRDEQGEILRPVSPVSKRLLDGAGSKLNASIREKLKAKVKGLQAKAVLSEGKPERKLRGLRELPIPDRFEEAEDEEEDYDPQLKASIRSAREWRKAKAKQRKPDGFPTEEEAYNFFVGTGGVAEEEERKPEARKQEEAPGDVVINVFQDALTQWTKQPYVSKKEQLEKENNIYIYPSTIPALREDKIPQGLVPRSLEDEGFYIGKPPLVEQTRISVMENRLLKSEKEAFSWFDENGDLKRLPDPVRPNPSRLPLSDELDPDLETFWGKAEVRQFDGKYINGDTGGRRYQLDIDVSTLSYTHHPLFSKEHVIASRLQLLYYQYCATMKKDLVNHLSSKLSTLREALLQLQELPDKMKKARKSRITEELDKRKKYYKAEIRQIRRQRDDAEYRDRMMLKNIFSYWQDIKRLREIQGFINTPVVLKIIRQMTNIEEEKQQRTREIQEELQDSREDYEEEYKDKYAEYEKQVLAWKKHMKLRKRKAQRKLEQSQMSPNLAQEGAEEEDLELLPRPEPPSEFDEDAALAAIEERLKRCRRRPGEPILTPELQSGANVTPTEQCPRCCNFYLVHNYKCTE